MTEHEANLNEAIEELSQAFLGRLGVVAISDAEEEGRVVIHVFVAGDASDAARELPQSARGFRVLLKQSGNLRPYR
jgi:hypothetical protein